MSQTSLGTETTNAGYNSMRFMNTQTVSLLTLTQLQITLLPLTRTNYLFKLPSIPSISFITSVLTRGSRILPFSKIKRRAVS